MAFNLSFDIQSTEPMNMFPYTPTGTLQTKARLGTLKQRVKEINLDHLVSPSGPKSERERQKKWSHKIEEEDMGVTENVRKTHTTSVCFK